jgi:hypothetical protein
VACRPVGWLGAKRMWAPLTSRIGGFAAGTASSKTDSRSSGGNVLVVAVRKRGNGPSLSFLRSAEGLVGCHHLIIVILRGRLMDYDRALIPCAASNRLSRPCLASERGNMSRTGYRLIACDDADRPVVHQQCDDDDHDNAPNPIAHIHEGTSARKFHSFKHDRRRTG